MVTTRSMTKAAIEVALIPPNPVVVGAENSLSDQTPSEALQLIDTIVKKTEAATSSESKIKQLMYIVASNGMMTEGNFLPWRDDFQTTPFASGITKNHLKERSLGWGISPDGRVYIALQYTMSKPDDATFVDQTSCFTVFKRFSDDSDFLSFRNSGKLNVDPQPSEILYSVEQLIKGNSLTASGGFYFSLKA